MYSVNLDVFGGNKFAISILYIKRYLHWRCFCRNKELTKCKMSIIVNLHECKLLSQTFLTLTFPH